MRKSRFKQTEVKTGDLVFFSIKEIDNNKQYWKVVELMPDGKIKVKQNSSDKGDGLLIDMCDVEILHHANP